MFKTMNPGTRSRVRASVFTAAVIILMITVVFYFSGIKNYMIRVLGILTPFLVGFAFAFLMVPIMQKLDGFLRKTLFKKGKFLRLCRGISAFVCVLFLLGCLTLLAGTLIPNVTNSIESLLNYATRFFNTHYEEINSHLIEWEIIEPDDDALRTLWNLFFSEVKSFTSFIFDNILTISNVLYSLLYNLLVGLIVMFYMLYEKDNFARCFKKLTYAFFPTRTADVVVSWTHKTNDLFAGFIRGKLLDSLIIGIITFFFMCILNRDYAILIAMIVGVTNIIPFFGPFIGGIPCGLIMLIVDPMQGLWFAIFILILQQIDGNIIGPYILGDKIGLSPLLVMISIILGSGLFGFAGMLLGVPVFGLVYAIVKAVAEVKLDRKNLPISSAAYDSGFTAPEEPEEEPAEEQHEGQA